MDRNRTFVLCTNTDTGLLKVIAFVTMLIDHIGYIFFPSVMWLRIIGRVAFPLFAYCLSVGAIYTRDIKRYAFRLLIFALVSQPFYTLAFYKSSITTLFDPIYYTNFRVAIINIFGNLHLNIGFTLLLGLWAAYGIKNQKYIYTVLAILFSLLPIFEYGLYGVGLIIFIYALCRSSKTEFGILVGIFLASPIILNKGFYNFFGFIIDPQGFAVLALPLMLLNINTKIRIPRLVNYGFYPAHLAVLYFINLFFSEVLK